MKKKFVIIGVFMLVLAGCNIHLTSKINHSQEGKKEIIELIALSDQELVYKIRFDLQIRDEKGSLIKQYYYHFEDENSSMIELGLLLGELSDLPPFLRFYKDSNEVYRVTRSALDEPQKIYIESLDSAEKFKEKYLRNNFSQYNIDLSDFEYYSIDYSGQHPLNSYTEHIFTTNEKVKYDINFFEENLELMIDQVIVTRMDSSLGHFSFYGTVNGLNCILEYSKSKDR